MFKMERLPNEIILKILCYCQTKDLLNLSPTCSLMKCFINCDKLWENLLKRDYPSDLLKDSEGLYESIFMKHIYINQPANLRYQSLRKKPKDYYKFLKYISRTKKHFYHKAIDMVWYLMFLSESYIPPYKIIIKGCEAELLLYLICDQKGTIYVSPSDIDDINKRFSKNNQKITRTGAMYDAIMNMLYSKVLKVLIDVSLDNFMNINYSDVEVYRKIHEILIQKGYCEQKNFNIWYNSQKYKISSTVK